MDGMKLSGLLKLVSGKKTYSTIEDLDKEDRRVVESLNRQGINYEITLGESQEGFVLLKVEKTEVDRANLLIKRAYRHLPRKFL